MEIKLSRDSTASLGKMFPDRGGHVIVGRVVGEGLDDASTVVAQMRVHPEGNFVSSVGTSGRPVGFRKQGYLPVDITPKGEPGSVEDVGEVRLEPLPEAMRAVLKGKLEVEGASSPAGASSTLSISSVTRSTQLRGDSHGISTSVSIPVAERGFSVSGLSPMQYVIKFQAAWSCQLRSGRTLHLKGGETLDLGTIRLERPRRSSSPTVKLPTRPSHRRLPGDKRSSEAGHSRRAISRDPRPICDSAKEYGKIRFLSWLCPMQDRRPRSR